MKTTYTNEHLQEVIDRACKGTSAKHPEIGDALALSANYYPTSWEKEQAARLTLARAFLDNLPEQTEQGVLSLSQLRPLSKAGPVPEGCVRYYFSKRGDDFGIGTQEEHYLDTHFADIRLPATEKPDFSAPIACSRIKPELETFEAHGKTWTRHTPGDPMPCDGERKVYVLTPKTGESEEPYKASMYAWTFTFKEGDWWGEIIGWRYADEPLVTPPEWTPQAGDVVRLKSGGPLMTVGCPTEHTIPSVSCAWFDGTTLCSTPIPTACLKLSTKEDAR